MFRALSIGFPNGICFFQSLFPATPTARLTVMPALHCMGRRNRVNTLHIINPMSDLGASWTPAVQQFRASTLETCNLTACYSHKGVTFDLLSLGRSVALTMRADIQLISPYHSSLALNRGGFPEGSACHHFDPIRYVVREASHPVISATAARPRRDRQEHAGYSPGGLTAC